MNIKKRIVSALMALVMTLSLVNSAVITAFAEGTQSAAPSTGETQNAGYELRVLTFEDADYKGGTNFAGKSDWSSLIDSPQYGGSMLYPNGSGTTDDSKAYTWYDAGNTELKHTMPKSWDNYCYWGGGHAVSNYASSDYVTNGDFNHQLTVYKAGAEGDVRTGGGHNGSNNFAVHFGYKDNSGNTNGQILPSFAFGDGMARVIDHMYVNSICYALNCYLNGNGQTAKIGDDDWVKLTATGYDGEAKTGEASIYLCNGPKNIVTDWTKFDLSSLGAVTKVEFNITGSSDNGYGFSQPAYFAYDDVAVRFEKSAEKPTEPEKPEQNDPCPPHEDADDNGFCDKCGEYLKKEVQRTDVLPVKLVIPEGAKATFYASADGTGKPIAAKDLGTDEKNPLIHLYELDIPAGSYSCMVSDETHNYGGVGFDYPLQTSIYEASNLTLALAKFYTTTTSVTVNKEKIPVNIDSVDDFTLNLVAPGKANIIPGENYLDDTIKSGTTYVVAPRMVWAYGNQILYNYTIDLNGELNEKFGVSPQINKTYQSSVSTILKQPFSVVALKTFTLTAPTAAETKFFNQINNFNDMVLENVTAADNGDGTTTYTVFYPSFSNASYRVTQDGFVTAAGYCQDNKAYTVELRKGDPTSTDTVIASKAGAGSNIEYENSVYLNIDDTKDTNELAMQVGDTFRLRAFRAAWEIVNTVTANIMIEPDFHYEVLAGKDVVSVTPVTDQCSGNAKGNWMDLRAIKEGTAVIAVWYDAIDVGGNTTLKGTYGATDPARYGYVVVNVGPDHTVSFRPVSYDGNWDAEFDTAYYFGDHGTLTIAPEGVKSVSVQNFNGINKGTMQIVTGKNGKYDVPLTSGSNLITVTTAEGSDYMFARAKKIAYTVENKTTGEKVVGGAPAIRKGDTVCIHFDQFNMPVAKMSGIYNPGFTGTAKTCYTLNEKYSVSSVGTQYDYITDAKSCITFTAMIPGKNTLSGGYIQSGSMGDKFGNHRNLTDGGRGTNFSAVNVTGYFGSIEDISFTVEDNPDASVNYQDMVKLKKLSIFVGESNYNQAGGFTRAGAENNEIWWTKTTAQMEGLKANYALRANVTTASYYSTIQMRYWYEGGEVHTAELTSGSDTIIPWSDFPHDSSKILNVQLLVTPGDPTMGPTKTYSFIWLPGSKNLQYVHPVLKSLTITDDGKQVDVFGTHGKGVAYTETSYTADVSGTVTLDGVQLQKYTNAANNKNDNADTVTVQKMKNGAPVGEAISVLPLTEERFPVGKWKLENLDITDADSLEIKVISYVDNTSSRTYHITFAHDFSVKTADAQHLKTAATCSKPAEYYFSCACGEVDKSENAKTFFAGATAPHRFRNGKCAVCGAADPLAAVKTEALKVDSQNSMLVTGSGLTITTNSAVTEEKLDAIKLAVEEGKLVIDVEDVELAALPAAESAALQSKLDKLSGRDAQFEEFVDVTLMLLSTADGSALGEIKELKQPITVSVPVSDHLKQLFADHTKTVRAIISHINPDGTITVEEKAVRFNAESGMAEIIMNKFSTVAFVSTTAKHSSSGGSGSSGYSGDHTFTTDLPAGSITAVFVDGKRVDSKHYTVSGSDVTLSAGYLKTLRSGKHTVRIENADKVATGTFTVEGKTGAVNASRTGDPGVAVYFAMGAMSFLGSAAWLRRRRDED